ncbi:MAG: rhomboid family intramembrane serine protease [Desulforegulaceae bacterium]|nr:rhomboid family intramembrane serine protease [Desulforegulaceae bacterium]
MIPIRDSHPSETTPVVNYSLIGLNVFIFFIEISHPGGMDRFIYQYGLVPARYTNPAISQYFNFFEQIFSFLSFMFLHGGWLHLIGNMWSLFIFGDNVEDKLGPFKYLLFYLLCGFISGFTHFMFNINDNIPVVGASGAIAGIMGAYFILFPGARILTVIPIIIIPWFIEIPAFIFLGLWFIIQVINAAGTSSGIAWWAHISGFAAGAFLVGYFCKLPSSKFSDRIKGSLQRKKSPEINTIKTLRIPDSNDAMGMIEISALEALSGCKKRANIPWGFYNRLYKITIPPNTRDRQKLRLRGLGFTDSFGNKGDLFIEVRIKTSFDSKLRF